MAEHASTVRLGQQSIAVTIPDEPISRLLNKEKGDVIFEHPSEKIWNMNSISLARRIKERPGLAASVDKVLTAENLSRYIVPVDPRAPKRCIDGRLVKNWAEDKRLQQRPLGAKFAGGTAHAALTRRIVDIDNIKSVCCSSMISSTS